MKAVATLLDVLLESLISLKGKVTPSILARVLKIIKIINKIKNKNKNKK